MADRVVKKFGTPTSTSTSRPDTKREARKPREEKQLLQSYDRKLERRQRRAQLAEQPALEPAGERLFEAPAIGKLAEYHPPGKQTSKEVASIASNYLDYSVERLQIAAASPRVASETAANIRKLAASALAQVQP